MKVFTKDRVKKDNHNMSKTKKRSTALSLLIFSQLSVDVGSTSTIGSKSSAHCSQPRMNPTMNW